MIFQTMGFLEDDVLSLAFRRARSWSKQFFQTGTLLHLGNFLQMVAKISVYHGHYPLDRFMC